MKVFDSNNYFLLLRLHQRRHVIGQILSPNSEYIISLYYCISFFNLRGGWINIIKKKKLLMHLKRLWTTRIYHMSVASSLLQDSCMLSSRKEHSLIGWHLLSSCSKQGINICKEEIILMHHTEIFHTLLLLLQKIPPLWHIPWRG